MDDFAYGLSPEDRFAAAQAIAPYRFALSNHALMDANAAYPRVMAREEEHPDYQCVIDVYEKLHQGVKHEALADNREFMTACQLQVSGKPTALYDAIKESVERSRLQRHYPDQTLAENARTTPVRPAECATAADTLERFASSMETNDPAWTKDLIIDIQYRNRLNASRLSFISITPPAPPQPEELQKEANRLYREQFEQFVRTSRKSYPQELKNAVGMLRRLDRGESITIDEAGALRAALGAEAPTAAANALFSGNAPWLPLNIYNKIKPAFEPVIAQLEKHEEYYRAVQRKTAQENRKLDKAQFGFAMPSAGGQLMAGLGGGKWIEKDGAMATELQLPDANHPDPDARVRVVGALIGMKKDYRMPSLRQENGMDWLTGKARSLKLKLDREDYQNAILPRKHAPLLALKAGAPGKEDLALDGFFDPQAKEYIIPIPAASVEGMRGHLRGVGIAEGLGMRVELDPAEPQKAYLSIAQKPYEASLAPLIAQIELVQKEATRDATRIREKSVAPMPRIEHAETAPPPPPGARLPSAALQRAGVR